MSFQQITANTLIGSMSAQHLSLALNGGAAVVANSSVAVVLGSIKSFMPGGKAGGKGRLIVRADGVYGAGESSVLVLRYQDDTGSNVDQALGTLDATTVTGAGEFTIFDGNLPRIPVGAVTQLVNTYTAGTPNAPAVSATLELF